jgi:hypothetical protein
MEQSRVDYNWLNGICIFLFLFNVFMFRQWVKSKRWVLKPVLIFIISFVISYAYNVDKQFKIAKDIFGIEKEIIN